MTGPLTAGDDAYRLAAFAFRNTEQVLRVYTVEGGTRLVPVPGAVPYGHPDPAYALRDPSVHRLGGRYVLAATRPPRADYLGPSTTFHLAASEDLRLWHPVADLAAGTPTGDHAWAPEFFVDDDGTAWLVYAVSDDNAASFGLWARRALDPALTRWAAPVHLDGLPNVIDGMLTRMPDGSIVCFAKDESTKTITRARSVEAVAGPYAVERSGDWLGIGGPAEGPELVPMPGGRWRLAYDRYTSTGLSYRDSLDGTLDHWGPEVSLTGPFQDLRHASYLWLSAGEWAALRARPRIGTGWAAAPRTVPAVAPRGSPALQTFDGTAGDPAMCDGQALIAAEDGLYVLTVQATWSPNASGSRGIAYRIAGGAWRYLDSRLAAGGGWGTECSGVTGATAMVAGTRVEVGVLHSATTSPAPQLTGFAATLTRS